MIADDQKQGREKLHSKIGRISLWTITVLGSALLTAFFKDYWEAPHPVLQITGFSFESAEGDKTEITVDPELLRSIAKHDYLPDLKLPITLADLTKEIAEGEHIREQWLDEDGHVRNIVALIRSQGLGISLENRRKALLNLIVDEPGDINIESRAKILVAGMEQALGPKYQCHPPGSEHLMVHLDDGEYNLSQVDEEKAAQDAGSATDVNAPVKRRIDAHRTNIFRRLLIYYDPDLLLNVFTTLEKSIADENREAEGIIGQLKSSEKGLVGQRIALDILISNRGQRPVAIRGAGVLCLEVPAAKHGNPVRVLVPLVKASDSEVTVVDGGKSNVIQVHSRDNLRDIVQANSAALGGDNWTSSRPLEESRFMLLFKAKTSELTAAVALVRAGEEPQRSRVGPSASLPVSQSATEQAIEQISSELR